MNKFLNILIIISFSFPFAYFSWIVWDWPTNYFYDMFDAMRHWTTGEMGYWHIYPILFAIGLLVVKYLYNEKMRVA